jgi:hypothetical protein
MMLNIGGDIFNIFSTRFRQYLFHGSENRVPLVDHQNPFTWQVGEVPYSQTQKMYCSLVKKIRFTTAP